MKGYDLIMIKSYPQTVDNESAVFLIIGKETKRKKRKKSQSKQQLIQWYLYDDKTKNMSIKSTKYDII